MIIYLFLLEDADRSIYRVRCDWASLSNS